MAKDQPRKEVSSLDQPLQSSDRKYYATRQGTSAIQRTKADSTLKDADAVTAIPTPRMVDPRSSRPEAGLPRSSDVYYANDNRARAVPPLKAQPPQSEAVQKGGAIEEVFIRSEAEITQQMAKAIGLIQGGAFQVRVGIADRSLLKHSRMAVEFAVTREQITEDQGRDIVFGIVPVSAIPAAGKVDPPAWPKLPASPEATTLDDPTKFAAPVEAPPVPVADLARKPESLIPLSEVDQEEQAVPPAEVAAEEAAPTESDEVETPAAEEESDDSD